jgi:hypothetical protein
MNIRHSASSPRTISINEEDRMDPGHLEALVYQVPKPKEPSMKIYKLIKKSQRVKARQGPTFSKKSSILDEVAQHPTHPSPNGDPLEFQQRTIRYEDRANHGPFEGFSSQWLGERFCTRCQIGLSMRHRPFAAGDGEMRTGPQLPFVESSGLPVYRPTVPYH